MRMEKTLGEQRMSFWVIAICAAQKIFYATILFNWHDKVKTKFAFSILLNINLKNFIYSPPHESEFLTSYIFIVITLIIDFHIIIFILFLFSFICKKVIFFFHNLAYLSAGNYSISPGPLNRILTKSSVCFVVNFVPTIIADIVENWKRSLRVSTVRW